MAREGLYRRVGIVKASPAPDRPSPVFLGAGPIDARRLRAGCSSSSRAALTGSVGAAMPASDVVVAPPATALAGSHGDEGLPLWRILQ